MGVQRFLTINRRNFLVEIRNYPTFSFFQTVGGSKTKSFTRRFRGTFAFDTFYFASLSRSPFEESKTKEGSSDLP